ncbi:unnamed protein product (macronuclear) [Paramecium tetraurelia]|uniref:Uncharacterized protein n=1 Tax=Paramecium tetraurelia TaxID=5888 RepID=A0BMV8_PARTE|nr:uncharacterized protein GSPATT00030512001 [Paramecium tetraurelia]CAK59875.1 unnamed protein product [Paramecium tetraurelia]|eukprot:XP_001427273.1 hypothetical protein (macronuclear) [Paramecium tetraurelia strain d4-2]
MMQNEEEYEQFSYQTNDTYVYAHVDMKDPMAEYSNQHKKRKGNEYKVYKDLRDRNALLTIYRAVQYDGFDEQNFINKIISWLQNHQKVILPKVDTDKYKLSEKSFLKHILTQICTKPADSNASDYIKKNLTLAHYVNEAAEKQGEGFVNNILMMVQAVKLQDQAAKDQDQIYLNYFAQAVAYQMKQSKKPQNQGESSLRCNKVIFINLTGKESAFNLGEWEKTFEKSDEFVYFSFIKVLEDKQQNYEEQFQEYEKWFSGMDMANFNYFLLPYYSFQKENSNNILHGQLVKTFFQNFMHNRIERFTHKAYIALSLSLSNDIEYDPFAIQFLINALTKLSNDRLMIHIDIELNERDNHYEQKLTQLMNLCYTSFQEQNIAIQKIVPQEKLELCDLINRLQKIFTHYNLAQLYKSILYSEIAIKNIQQEIKQSKNTPLENKIKEHQRIFYKKSSLKYYIIVPELEKQDMLTPYTQVIINYQDDIIILYQDGKNKYLYFIDLNKAFIKEKKLMQKLKFTNLTNILGPQDIKNQIVFYFNFNIYILYGQNESDFNRQGSRFSLKDDELYSLQYDEQQKLTQGSFHQKVAIQKLEPQVLIEKLKPRVSPTVCIDSYTDQVLKVVLFGGENIYTPQIMNLVEYMEIKETSFSSCIIDKNNLYKDLSFKPYPGQTILNFKIQNDILYLILPGNDVLRQKAQNHPINSQFSQNAILMKKGCTDFSISNIPFKYYGDDNYMLSSISNNQQNSQLIFFDDNLAVWRVIYSQQMKRETIEKVKLTFSCLAGKDQETKFSNKREKCFTEQHDEIDMIFAYYIEIQKDLNEADIESFFQKKYGFNKSNQGSGQIIQNIEQQQQQESKLQQEGPWQFKILDEADFEPLFQKKYELNKSKQGSEQIFQNKEYQYQESKLQQEMNDNIKKYIKKLKSGKLFDLSDNNFNRNFGMQEERGNYNDDPYFQQEFFKSNVLDIYDADTNQLFSVAFENYLYLDTQTKQLSVKQFTYLIGDPIGMPQIDIINQQGMQEVTSAKIT